MHVIDTFFKTSAWPRRFDTCETIDMNWECKMNEKEIMCGNSFAFSHPLIFFSNKGCIGLVITATLKKVLDFPRAKLIVTQIYNTKLWENAVFAGVKY